MKTIRGADVRAVAACVLGVVGALVAFAMTASSRSPSVNSDLLYPLSMWRDLVMRHEPLSGWSLTPAPYLFPDLPLFAMIAPFAPSGMGIFDVYVVVYAACLFLCLAALGAVMRRLELACALCCVILATIATTTLGELSFQVGYHGGGISLMYLCVIFCVLWVRRAPRPRLGRDPYLIAYVVCASMAIMSDLLTLFHTALPMALSVLYVMRREVSRREAVKLGGVLLVVPAVLGTLSRLAFSFITGLRVPAGLSLNKAPGRMVSATHWETVASGLMQNIVENKAAFLFTVLALCCGVYALRTQRRSGEGQETPRDRALLLAFSVISPIVLVTATVLTFKYEDSMGLRYLQSALFSAPLCFLFFNKIKGLGRKMLLVATCVLPWVACLALMSTGHMERALPRQQWMSLEARAKPVECLAQAVRERELRFGVAGYWKSKYLMEQVGDEDLRLVSFEMDTMTPRDWINNACWYLDERGEPLKVQFAVVDQAEEVSRWPEPWRSRAQRAVSCEGFEVWTFAPAVELSASVLEEKAGVARCGVWERP